MPVVPPRIVPWEPERLRKLPLESPTKALASRLIAALLVNWPVCCSPPFDPDIPDVFERTALVPAPLRLSCPQARSLTKNSPHPTASSSKDRHITAPLFLRAGASAGTYQLGGLPLTTSAFLTTAHRPCSLLIDSSEFSERNEERRRPFLLPCTIGPHE